MWNLISFLKLLTSTPLTSPVFWAKWPHQRCTWASFSIPSGFFFMLSLIRMSLHFIAAEANPVPLSGCISDASSIVTASASCLQSAASSIVTAFASCLQSLLPLKSCSAVVVSPCPGTDCTLFWNKLIHSHTVSSPPDFKFFDDRANVQLISKSSIMSSPILYVLWTLHVITVLVLVVKNSPNNADVRDPGSVPGSGRSPGKWNGNPLQYSCLGKPMDREARWATVHGSQRVGVHAAEHTHTHTHTRVCF